MRSSGNIQSERSDQKEEAGKEARDQSQGGSSQDDEGSATAGGRAR